MYLNTLCWPTPLQIGRCGWRQEANVCRGKSVQALVVPLAVILFLASCLSTQAFTPFRIGTGGSTGVYYPVGKLIATGLTLSAAKDSSVLKGFIGVAQNSAGSIENVRAVIAGELEAGMVQADIAALAYSRRGDFAGLPGAEDIRAVACLYSEKFQLVVRKDAGIDSIRDLKGKKISLDEMGSGTRAITNIILQAHGLSEKDLQGLYLKPAFTEDRIKNGELQGFTMMAGAPNAAVSKLLDTGITILPIDPSVAVAISQQYKYLAPGKISKGTYGDLPETPTLEVYALLVVRSAMSDDMVYAVTEALFSPATIKLLQEGHPLGREITLDSALLGISIPLHPGADRFYRDRGMVRQ